MPSNLEEMSYRVVEPYIPVHDGEIALIVGDIVTNVRDLGNGWTLARNISQDTVGIFPSGFISAISEISDIPWDSCLEDSVISNTHASGCSPGDEDHGYQVLREPPPDFIDNKSEPDKQQRGNKVLGEQVLSQIPEQQAASFSSPDTPTHPYFNHLGCSTVGSKQRPSDGEDSATTEDEYRSNSLPTPKRKRKPQILVKPNMGKSRFQPPQQTSSTPPQQENNMEGSLQQELLKNPMFRNMQMATSSGSPIPSPNPNVSHVLNPRSRTPSIKHENEMNDIQEAVIENQNTRTPQHQMYPPEPIDAMNVIHNPAPVSPLHHHTVDPVHNMEPNMVMGINENIEHPNNANDHMRTGSVVGTPQVTPKLRAGEIPRQYYRDYRTLECPPHEGKVLPTQAQLRYKPVLKGKHNPYGDPRTREIAMRKPDRENPTKRLVGSVFFGLLFGGVLFLWMYYYLEYSFLVTLFVCGILAIILCIVFALSRLCRCVAALLIPSICTTRGRISFLILITGFIIGGPITDIYHNMAEVSRSMGCSAEQSFNQSMLLLQPFDNMMMQLNSTINRLQFASRNVSKGLVPLDDGLDRVEMDIYDGKYHLTGTKKTCENMVDKAFDDCARGIRKAQDQCLGVIDALGTVYHQARDVLDAINPERFAPKHAATQLQKRQVFLLNGQTQQIPGNDKDICEPLDTVLVCHSLNDSEAMCDPSGWAGVAIQDAINATQNAMGILRKTLHFEVHPEPYYNARMNASLNVFQVRQKVQGEFYQKTQYFDLIINILKKVIPASIIILIYVAYLHVRNYVSRDTYDNVYVTVQFKTLDQKRAEVAGESLLPLKKYERNYLIDTTTSDLSPPEDGLYRIGLCVLLLHFLIAFICYLFDYILFWILAMIRKHADPNYDVTGRDTLELVITGEGVITDLLHIFLKGFHPANLFGYTVDMQACLPSPIAPSIITLLVVFFLYFALVLTILLKAYILRFRNKVTAYFYPDREKARIVHLYNAVLNSRLRMPKLLQHKAKLHYREKVLRDQVSISHNMAAKLPPFRPFVTENGKCLVCGSVEDQTFRDCQTDKCQGIYCSECYEDLGRVCPLCLHSPDYSEDEEYDYEELEADDLQPYHRSSKIYV